MSATIAAPRSTTATSETLRTLAVVEAKRFARHPLFLVGVALSLWALWSVSDDRSVDALSNGLMVTFFIGVFGYVVAHRLTRSTRSSQAVMDGTPSSTTLRTAALCMACLVPATTGFVLSLALFAALRILEPPTAAFVGLGTTEQFLLLVVHPTVACVGGPLLGVATGRWWRFPGAALLGAVLLVLSCILSFAPVESGMDPNTLSSTFLHVLAPYTFFTTNDTDDGWAVLYPGSLWWYAVWQLCLSGLAVLAALLKDAAPPVRRRVLRVGALVSVAAIAALILTTTGGVDAKTRHNPDGSTEIVHTES